MATKLQVDKFLTEFKKKYGRFIPLLCVDEFLADVLDKTNRYTRFGCDDMDDEQYDTFQVLHLAFADWSGTTKELENVLLGVMDEMGFLEDTNIEPTIDIEIKPTELKTLYSVVQEYTGSETYRLYAMFIVRKLERLAAGRQLPAKFSGLNEQSSEHELNAALAELGD